MAQAYPRQPAGRPPVDVIPLAPTPSEQQSSQWPTFALTPAQRAAVRASGTARGDQAPWLLTTPMTAPTFAEVMLSPVPLPPAASDATGTLTGVGHEALVGATAASRSIRTSGPQPGPVGHTGAATPTARPAVAGALGAPAAPSGVRVAPAQQPPQRAVAQAPAQRGLGARVGNVAANRAPVWSPTPTGQGMAPSTLDAPGQRLAWASVTLSVVAALVCWLAVLLAPLGLAPLALAVAGVIVGHIAQRRTLRASGERRLALTGVTLGYLGAIASVGLLIFVVTHGGG